MNGKDQIRDYGLDAVICTCMDFPILHGVIRDRAAGTNLGPFFSKEAGGELIRQNYPEAEDHLRRQVEGMALPDWSTDEDKVVKQILAAGYHPQIFFQLQAHIIRGLRRANEAGS